MNRYALSHLDDHVLLRDLATHVARNCTVTADLLAHIAEVDARKLYRPAAHPSMHSYCVHVLNFSEQEAYKRIRVARLAREFPAILTAVAEGRLHLGGVVLLSTYLTKDTVSELIAAATHKTCAEIESVLAERFPKPDLPVRVEALKQSVGEPTDQLSTWRVQPGAVDQLSPGIVDASTPRPKVTPLAPERYSVQFTLGKEAHDKLRYAQSLLAHQVPAGDLPEVFERGLDALIAKLEKSKFAATDRPRTGRQRTSTNPRHIPAHVKRAVRERDGERCTFVSEAGARCPAVRFLEFDHITEVARGGEATVDGMRLRCRTHNQYEAERTFGAGFMEHKREQARRAADERRAVIETRAAMYAGAAEERRATDSGRAVAERAADESCEAASRTEAEGAATEPATTERAAAELEAADRAAAEYAAADCPAAERATELDLIHCLKGLGFRAEQAQLAIRHSASIPDASIEERLRASIKFLGSRGRTYALRQAVAGTGGAARVSAP